MDKVYAGARALAILAAIVAAFVTIPNIGLLLLVLGAIAGIGSSTEENRGLILVALVLVVGAKSLDVIPVAGSYLDTIFSGLGVAVMGSVLMGITLAIVRRVRGDWMPAASA